MLQNCRKIWVYVAVIAIEMPLQGLINLDVVAVIAVADNNLKP